MVSSGMHTAILIILFSNEEQQGIEHVHIGLVVWQKGCHLYMQDGILPFVKSKEADLKKAGDRHTKNKDPGGVHLYSLLIANYGDVMAVPTNPPYCLVYPTMYNYDAEVQNHLTQQPVLQGCAHTPAFARYGSSLPDNL